ncbi:MAG: helix-turn-helix transcriptional regulator, partial [Bacteroides sp.]|nr:helix-turn-helix transcriptional regulator [Bacteroides sp.]
YRKVKALLGTTPSNLIREGRMKKAETLLHMPGITVVQVAYEVGFTSQSYFTKCYKEFFGKLPTKDKE